MSVPGVDILWDDAPEDLRLPAAEVHVWAARQSPGTSFDRFTGLLSADEQARAARYYFERDRVRYTMRRGILRELVHRYAGIEPAAIAFSYGPKGKPELAHPSRSGLHFNVTDSGDLALFAFARVPGLGVDVEEVRVLKDASALARRFFSQRESEQLATVSPSALHETFLNCWTRKEAFIKAIGDGLSYPLDRFDVSLLPGDDPVLLRIQGDEAAAASWSLWHLAPASGFIGAAAVPARDLLLRCFGF